MPNHMRYNLIHKFMYTEGYKFMPDTEIYSAPGKNAKKTDKGLSGARSYKVIKSNDLIQKARFDLSVQEQKIILYLISKIKPEDDKLTIIKFTVKEFCSVCGINLSGKNYNDINNVIQTLVT